VNGPEVTRLILSWKAGDAAALDQVTELLYDDLRRRAASFLRQERPGHTLQATALVNEAWVRMAQLADLDWKDRAHFLGIAARLMRQILIQHARTRKADKRGGEAPRVTLDEGVAGAVNNDDSLIALDDALTALALVDERKSRMLELRYFAGLELTEIAQAMDISESTVKRQIRLAHAWLHRHMSGEDPSAEEKDQSS
jgi:RNA polymerase sigma factor (TIGR02999 family)